LASEALVLVLKCQAAGMRLLFPEFFIPRKYNQEQADFLAKQVRKNGKLIVEKPEKSTHQNVYHNALCKTRICPAKSIVFNDFS